MNLHQLAVTCGIPDRTVYSWQSRPSMPRGPTLAVIAQKVGCSLRWLAEGIGDPWEREGEAMAIPVWITGGGEEWMASEQAEPYHRTFPRDLIGFEVRGDSMDPVLRHGQIALAHRRVWPEDGDLAVVQLKGGEHMVKRVYLQREEVLLVSLNTATRPKRVRRADILFAHKLWGAIY